MKRTQDSRIKLKVRSKTWLELDKGLVFGTGRSLIFKAIAQTGSMNKAAEKLGMSYRRLWGLITSAEKRLGRRLILRSRGGTGGGGTVLSDDAQDLMHKFEKLEKGVQQFVAEKFREIFDLKECK